MDSGSATARDKDWTAHCSGQVFWWALPLVVGISAGLFNLSLADTGFVWAGVLAWMGTGCVLNAWRCGRLHCFFSGPVLWGGAIAAVLIGFRVLRGAHILNYVLWGTAALVAVSYLLEAFWGRYAHRS